MSKPKKYTHILKENNSSSSKLKSNVIKIVSLGASMWKIPAQHSRFYTRKRVQLEKLEDHSQTRQADVR